MRSRQALNLSPVYNLWEWQESAACKGADTENFFLDYNVRGANKREAERNAIRVCKRCPVILQCREWALSVPEDYGVWGGLTADQRTRILRRKDLI